MVRQGIGAGACVGKFRFKSPRKFRSLIYVFLDIDQFNSELHISLQVYTNDAQTFKG